MFFSLHYFKISANALNILLTFLNVVNAPSSKDMRTNLKAQLMVKDC